MDSSADPSRPGAGDDSERTPTIKITEGPAPTQDHGDDLEVQRSVRALLTSQPDPGSMPSDVEGRVRAALAQAVILRTADEGLMDDLGMEAPANDDDTDYTQRADRSDGEGTTGHLRRRWPVLLAAAAVLALVVIAGSVVVRGLHSPNDGMASLPGVGSTEGSAGTNVTALHIQISETAYDEATLPGLARTLLSSPGPAVQANDAEAPAVGPLATTAGASACLVALGEGDAPMVSVDLATFDAQPAAVIVIQRPAGAYAVVVQRGCTTGDRQVIQDAVPVP